jgi:hypothetical protein
MNTFNDIEGVMAVVVRNMFRLAVESEECHDMLGISQEEEIVDMMSYVISD